MTLTEAIKRIKYTVAGFYKPNQTDIHALNEILKCISDFQKNGVNDNRVFAKLLCLYIKEKYNDNHDIKKALAFLSAELKQPLDFHIEVLANKMNATQLTNYIKTLTVDVPNSEFNDVIALAKRENQFWQVHQKNILNEIMFYNSPEAVKSNFYTTANEILNNENYRV